MNTKQLKYVLVLANEGSFSKAADILNISQPSLSQYIKKIEKEVGLTLFDRTNGDVRLTDAGRVYIDAGKKILDIEHQMDMQFSDLSAHRTGSLVIGAATYRATGMMPVVARRFQEIHPGMHLFIREGTTAELAEGMEHGEYDLCLTMLPIDVRLFAYEKVVEEELVLAVPIAFPELKAEKTADRKYEAIRAKQIDGQRFVMLTETQFMQKHLKNLCIDYGLSIQKAAVVKSLGAQIAMVRAGVGMALVPSGIETFCSKDEVRFYSFKETLPKRDVVVMWRRDRELSQSAKELKDIFKVIKW